MLVLTVEPSIENIASELLTVVPCPSAVRQPYLGGVKRIENHA